MVMSPLSEQGGQAGFQNLFWALMDTNRIFSFQLNFTKWGQLAMLPSVKLDKVKSRFCTAVVLQRLNYFTSKSQQKLLLSCEILLQRT